MVKNSPANVGDRDVRLVPGSGRSPEEGNGNPVFLPGGSQGQRSLVGKESDTTHTLTHTHTHQYVSMVVQLIMEIILLTCKLIYYNIISIRK